MASIIARPRKDGTKSYRVQIVIKKKGEIIHRESETFSKKKDAELWAKKREVKLAAPGEVEKAQKSKARVTVKKLIELYEEKVGAIKSWGRSKDAVLNSWKERGEGEAFADEVNSAWLIDYCIKRSAEEGAGPATIKADISFLRSVFSVAKDVLGVPVNAMAFIEAQPTLKKLGLVGKSEERDRRPDIDEISAIIEVAYKARHSAYGRSRNQSPVDKIIVFQMFSGRRISETCRIEWKDLDRENHKVLVRDMKDPGRKQGNDVWVLIPDEAWSVLESMPEIEGESRIFPFDSKSVSTRFDRYRSKAGFHHEDTDENLKLHDLRHECLSWLAEKNGLKGEHWDIPRIQMVSGHKTWNVLQRYVNLLEEEPTDKWKGWEWVTKVLD